MKIAVIADIHGNLPALEAVLAECKERQVEEYIFLGDYVLDFPYPNECIDRIKSISPNVICGNRDGYMVNYTTDTIGYKQMAPLHWTYNELRKDNIEYLKSLKDEMMLEFDGVTIHISHFTKYSFKHENGIFDIIDMERVFDNMDWDIELFGHTHRPIIGYKYGRYIFNPGSCGLSLTGDNRAHFGIINTDNGNVSLEQCYASYDMKALEKSFYDTGLIKHGGKWAENIMQSITRNKRYVIDFLLFAKLLMAEHGRSTDGVVDNDIWDLACSQYDYDEELRML